MRADGEHAPFTKQNQNKADNPRAGDDRDEDGADTKKNVHSGVKHGRECVAAFSNKYKI